MGALEKTVSVTEFKAKCLSLMEDVSKHKVRQITVVKRGKPLVVIVAPRKPAARKSIFGALKGSVVIPEGLDLTKPVFEGEIDAEKGILHR
jgi:prevent-host-death family protein